MPSNAGAKLNYGPIHNNSNLTCAVSIRVGQEDANTSDMLEVAFLPIDVKYNLHQQFKFFTVKMRPSWGVDLKVAKLTKDSIEEFNKATHDQVSGFSSFCYWADNELHLKRHKKIIPLTWDWSTVKPYLKSWMGEEGFDTYISDNHRDLMSLVNFFNDRSDFWGEEVEFKLTTPAQMFNKLGVELIEKNSMTANCMGYIEANKTMLRKYIPGYTPK